MAKGNKFGTFGGVFTPAVLTILGVIMYLRLPWIVGNGGLWLTLGIIVAAHIISVTTGLSVASIATDKKVEAGGPYYIVSRSLGLPIGGTLGLALFIGLSFSVSLYIIGFCESFLPSVLGVHAPGEGASPEELAAYKDTIRIAGTVVLLALTGVTLISTAFAIKAQYFIMGAIALSLVSILLGTPPEAPAGANAGPALTPLPGGASLATLFGIFFPAVTGFTAGVNMSGDLKDPRRALPLGTIAAIAVGFIVYVGLAVFLAYRVPAQELVDNKQLLTDMAWIPELVLAGIWGATLSSAIGSILGAPRILQAKSQDGITPRWFARGYGPTNEPRNALLLTFAIAEAGILIGELDAIAAIVSMFFIMTYGFLNLSAAIESWASPDFRPEFRVPVWVPVLGVAASVIVMVEIDPVAMVGASLILAFVFAIYKRRELTLESGDTWEGVWSAFVRSGLHRLSSGARHARNWRPNILAFVRGDTLAAASEAAGDAPPQLPAVVSLGADLVARRGVLTVFELVSAGRHRGASPAHERAFHAAPAEGLPVGVFLRRLPVADPDGAAADAEIASVVRYYGFSGVEPNTVLVDWADYARDPARLAPLLAVFAERGFHVVVLARGDAHPDRRSHGRAQGRMDIWWTPRAGSFPFSLALVRFLTTHDRWHGVDVRFLLVHDGEASAAALYRAAERTLYDARVTATVKVIDASVDGRSFDEMVRQGSVDAALTIVGLPRETAGDAALLDALRHTTERMPDVLLVRAGADFPETLPVGDAAARARPGAGGRSPTSAPAEPAGDATERPVARPPSDAQEAVDAGGPPPCAPALPALEDVALAVTDAAAALQAEAQAQLVERPAQALTALDAALRDAITRAFSQLDAALSGPPHPRQRRTLQRVQGTFYFQASRLLIEAGGAPLDGRVAELEAGARATLQAAQAVVNAAPRVVEVTRPLGAFAPVEGDPAHLRRLKRRRRLVARLTRRPPRCVVPVGPLVAAAVWGPVGEALDELLAGLAKALYEGQVERERLLDAAQVAFQRVGRALAGRAERPGGGAREAAAQDADVPAEAAEAPVDVVRRERDALLAQLDALEEAEGAARRRARVALEGRLRRALGGLCDDLERLDVRRVARARRAAVKGAVGREGRWVEAVAAVHDNLRLLLRRGELATTLAGLHHRLTVITARARGEVVRGVAGGVRAEVAKLRAAVAALDERLRAAAGRDGAGEAAGDVDGSAERGAGEGGLPLRLESKHDLRRRTDVQAVLGRLEEDVHAAVAELPEAVDTVDDEGLAALAEAPGEPVEAVTVSLRRLVESVIEADLVGELGQRLATVPAAEQRAVEVAEDVYRLVNFTLSDLSLADSAGGAAEGEGITEEVLGRQLAPVLTSALRRLDEELARLDAEGPAAEAAFDAQLGLVLDRTNAYAIVGSGGSTAQYVRSRSVRRRTVFTRAGELVGRAGVAGRARLTAGLYKLSAGAVFARRLRGGAEGDAGLVERLLRVTEACEPSPAVEASLPFYYRHLFVGKSQIGEDFWVARPHGDDAARRALEAHARGRAGVLLITGPAHAGKTALAHHLEATVFRGRPMYHVHPPPGGSDDAGALAAAFSAGFRLPGTPGQLLSSVSDRSVVVLHDVELWWRRNDAGLLRGLMGDVGAHGGRVLFVVTVNEDALPLLDRAVGLSARAVAVARCGALDAKRLGRAIDLRHRSTGMVFQMAGPGGRGDAGVAASEQRGRGVLTDWRLARLHTALFRFSRGNVGVALGAWLTAVRAAGEGTLSLVPPEPPDAGALEALPPRLVALLAALVLHRALTRERLAAALGHGVRVPSGGVEAATLEADLGVLLRAGLVTETPEGVLEVNRFVFHMVRADLRERGVIA